MQPSDYNCRPAARRWGLASTIVITPNELGENLETAVGHWKTLPSFLALRFITPGKSVSSRTARLLI